MYQIVDEPKKNTLTHFVVNPLAILLAAIIVPLFLALPLYGRVWMPFLWFVFNGYCLGSPTLKKEIILACLGCFAWVISMFVFIYSVSFFSETDKLTPFAPYLRITQQAILFLFLYLILNLQTAPYAIYEYLKKQGE